ncbi:MAG: shikimate kinase [Desulfobacteraceae bacterium]
MDIEAIAHENLILIGMPAVGKSTLGLLLAKRIGFAFIDTDLLIQTGEGMSLKRIIHKQGKEGFCDLEANYLQRLSTRRTVIATGGSAIYRSQAMDHLESLGTIVFLDIQLDQLTQRLIQLDQRGVVSKPGQSVEQLCNERRPLYRQYANITVDCSHCTQEEAVIRLVKALR